MQSGSTCGGAESSPSSRSPPTRSGTANAAAPPAGPPAFDADDYRGRNVIERSFCDQKQWRGIATRYDKLAITYRGGAVVMAITIWLKAPGETP